MTSKSNDRNPTSTSTFFSFIGKTEEPFFSDEKSNRLGNVQVVVSDRKVGVDSTGDGKVDWYRADVRSAGDYFPGGMVMPGRNFSTPFYQFGYQGQLKTDEVYGSGNLNSFEFREQDARAIRFWGVDPLAPKYPGWSPYAFSQNRMIDGIDLEGLEFYYAAGGTMIGKIGKNTSVRVVNENDVKTVTAYTVWANNTKDSKYAEYATNKANTLSTELGVNNDLLVAFAAVIDLESGGAKDESYAIGNTTMNYLGNGGSVNNLKTLEDVVFYDNTFAQGATQNNYTSFKARTSESQNSEYALGAAINAIGFSKGKKGFSDYSDGATGWDGVDLVSTKWTNSHRKYKWSEGSKSLLEKYKKDNKGGVDVSKWTYKKSGFDISATKIVGKSLYQKLEGTRGEKKENKTKFK